MGKTGKWLKSFLKGKKDDKKEIADSSYSPLPAKTRSSPILVPPPKEKRRWSFRRSADAGKSSNSPEMNISLPVHGLLETEISQKRHAMAVAVATAAAADAAVAAAQAAVAAMRLTSAATRTKATAVEEAAATKIQSVFRAYLARKALCALRGLVKLQALVRGHLVRKQAAATLRCMQALVTAQEQARGRAQRIRMAKESLITAQQQSIHRRSPLNPRSRLAHDTDRNMAEENITTVEVDLGGWIRSSTRSRSSYSMAQTERLDGGPHSHCSTPSRIDRYQQFLLAPSALTEMSPRAYSGHFENFSFAAAAQSSPQCLPAAAVPVPDHYHLFPNYMANTESSRAKARSQSAPKQRTDAYEQQASRRRASEGRNIPRGIKMQRSSSHVGMVGAGGYQFPWSVQLDKSNVSLRGSECGSTSSVLTNTSYCRSLAGFEANWNNV